MVLVPMQRGAESDRALYLVDSNRKIKTVKLPAHSGRNSNPLMQPSRDTIIYLNAGALRVMAADGSGDRKLFDRDPGGCDKVHHAAWSQSDPKVILIACQVSETKLRLLVVGIDGKLIRRLDTGLHIVNDATLSPDGQTVLYRASSSPYSDVGTLYTLPIIGTGAPKQLINYSAGTDAEPAWSPDGTKIAFRRRVPNGTLTGNDDIYVVKTDGSGARAVPSTPAHDFKPIWSPDGKNLLIASNRESDVGGPGETYDLWLTRVRDGKVLARLGLKAKQVTRSFWTLR
jgi:Tol biopolymer transport system component